MRRPRRPQRPSEPYYLVGLPWDSDADAGFGICLQSWSVVRPGTWETLCRVEFPFARFLPWERIPSPSWRLVALRLLDDMMAAVVERCLGGPLPRETISVYLGHPGLPRTASTAWLDHELYVPNLWYRPQTVAVTLLWNGRLWPGLVARCCDCGLYIGVVRKHGPVRHADLLAQYANMSSSPAVATRWPRLAPHGRDATRAGEHLYECAGIELGPWHAHIAQISALRRQVAP